MVYPRVIHFPKREQPHQLAFQLVGFFKPERDVNPTEITSQLGDFEFKLSGLWQFIPVCQTPCVSVFKNYTEERKEFVKAAEVALKVSFMKGSHVPLIWRDAPVRPFRFNLKFYPLPSKLTDKKPGRHFPWCSCFDRERFFVVTGNNGFGATKESRSQLAMYLSPPSLMAE